jgi:hypothetical protein
MRSATGRGGRREGAGRPPICADRPKRLTFAIRVDAAEHAMIQARGGTDYLRRLIAADSQAQENG